MFGAQRWNLTEVAKLKLLFARRSEALDSNWFGNWHARTCSCCCVEHVEMDIGIRRFTDLPLQKQNHKQPNSFSSSISRFLATTAVKRLAGEDDADANQDGDGLSPHHWGTYNKWMGSEWAWWICMLKCVPWFCWSIAWLKFGNRMKLIWLAGNVHMMWYDMYRHIIIYT